ncbi:hypothetical protein [Bordetella trematum]|uniref:hypothetical protein n=1 Tax=Bordetella trematum TaxID=123899 RepID=UPI003988F249
MELVIYGENMKFFFDFSSALEYSPKQEFCVFVKGQIFPCAWNITGHEKTVLFFPGATRTDAVKPIFQRSSYFNELPYNCVSFFDPTLLLSKELTLGWFQGKVDGCLLDLFDSVFPELTSALKVKNKDITIFGTSGAGIPGFHAAMNLPGCTLYSGNIQTDISRYYKGKYREMLLNCYPGLTGEVARDMYKDRITILDVDGDFNMIYAQNMVDVFHYENHFIPFLESYERKNFLGSFFTYSDEHSGHGPLGRKVELEIIKCIVEGGQVESILPSSQKLSVD